MLVKEALARGLDVEALLRVAHIDAAVLEDPSARIPSSSQRALWRAGARQSGDDAIGLHVAERWLSRGEFGLMEYLLASSATLRTMCEQGVRFVPLLADDLEAVFELHSDGMVVFGFRRLGGNASQVRHQNECCVAGMVMLARSGLGEEWAPRAVLFEHPEPKSTREHQRFFRTPLRFRQSFSGLLFDASWLDRSWARSEPQLHRLLVDYSSRLMATLPKNPAFAEQVRRIIARGLPRSTPSAAQVARELGLGVRTLQRKLDMEGRTFRQVVDEVRLSRALQLLEDGAHSMAEVAYQAGFTDQNAFSRAFKRMTGHPPTQAREQLKGSTQHWRDRTEE